MNRFPFSPRISGSPQHLTFNCSQVRCDLRFRTSHHRKTACAIPVSSGQQLRGRVHTTKSWNVLQPIGHDFLAPNLKKQNLLFRAFGIYNWRRESVDARHFLQTTPQIQSGRPQAPSHASLADYMLFLNFIFQRCHIFRWASNSQATLLPSTSDTRVL